MHISDEFCTTEASALQCFSYTCFFIIILVRVLCLLHRHRTLGSACVALGLLCVSSGTSTDVYSNESREHSLTFPSTDNGPEQGGAPQHMSLQSTHSVRHPTAEMRHSSDPLSAPTTHLISRSGS